MSKREGPFLEVKRTSDRVLNLGTLSTQAAQRRPNHPAVIWGDHKRSWAEFNARADSIALQLINLGIVRGDRVMIHSPNCPEMLEAMIAVLKAGAVMVPTNFRLSPEDIADMAQRTEVKVIIGHVAYPEHSRIVQETADSCRQRIIIEGDNSDGFDLAVKTNMGKPFHDVDVEYNDPCWFFFTSGTTGKPKIATLTHGHMSFITVNHIADLMPGLGDGDISMAIAPLSHGAGAHFFPQIARAVPTVLAPGTTFDPSQIWALVEKHKVTNMFTVPTIVKRLTEHPTVDNYDLSSLKHVVYAGAPMYRQDQKHALSKIGKVFVQYFGLGEVTGCITVLPAHEHSENDDEMPVGSCGFPRTGIDVAILSDKGERLKPFETGNISVGGVGVFAGYYQNNTANEETFADGWFMTGDLGHVNEHGYVYITGRRSDMYISGGSNIYPRETEEKILEHPAIAEVAIVGVPDREWGETGVAIVILNDEVTYNNADFESWLQTKVARYKQPKRIYVWDEMPKSGYGKIEKKRIKEILEEQGLIEDIR